MLKKMSRLTPYSIQSKLKSFLITGTLTHWDMRKIESVVVCTTKNDALDFFDDHFSEPITLENINIKDVGLHISDRAFIKIKKELSTTHSHSVDIRKQLRKDGQFHRFFHRHFTDMFDALRNVNLKDEEYIIKDRLDFYKNLKGILEHEIYMIENE